MKRIWIAYICLLGSLIHPLQIEAEEEFGTPLLPPKTKRAELTEGIWQDYVKTKPEGYVEVGDTIFIYDEEAFAWLSAKWPNGGFEGKFITLKTDLDLSGKEFFPLANGPVATFRGVFDGNMHTIKGLTIAAEVIDRMNSYIIALFGYNSGIIKNLIIEDYYIYSNGMWCAVLVGINHGLVENCHTDGIICNFGNYSSGMVGHGYSSEIKNCTTSGKISVIKRTPSIGWQWAAGFASYGGVKIQNSANFARIYGVGRGAGISIHGLYTVNCANYGYVTGENVGGIQVETQEKFYIINCFNTGKVSDYGIVGNGFRPGSVFNVYNVGSELFNTVKRHTFQNIFWKGIESTFTYNKEIGFSSFEGKEESCKLDNYVFLNLNEEGDSVFTNNLIDALNGWCERNSGYYTCSDTIDENIDYTVPLARWIPDTKLLNNGYPLIKGVPYRKAIPRIVTKDTTITICAGVEYGDRVYTNEDHETVQQLRVGDVIYQKAKLLVKSPSFDKIGFNGPKFLCKGQTFDFNAHGGESYQWVVNDRVHSNSAYCGINPSIYPCALIELEVMKDGCPHTIYDTIPVEVDTFLVEMKGWGDVIAINNKDSLCVAYQWYRDGEILKGEVGQYYYEAGGLTPGKYTAKIFLSDSTMINTCPLQVEGLEKTKSAEVSVRSYPIPACAEEVLSVEVQNVDDFSSGTLFIYDEKGRLFYKEDKVRKINNFKLPEGCFIVVFKQGEVETRGHKIIVKK